MDWIDCGYIIPNYARDSDSAKEFNDYYRIIGRNEAAPPAPNDFGGGEDFNDDEDPGAS